MSQKADITELLKTQISLTEWFEAAGHKDTEALRLEDNQKPERLEFLNKVINLPYDKPTQMLAIDLVENTPVFQEFYKDHNQDLCALRLVPLDPKLPKLRMRGHTVEKAMVWFYEQSIDPKNYKAYFVPHSDNTIYSTIFVIAPRGIYGEIIQGRHHQLTHGFHDEGKPETFFYDYQTWPKDLPEDPKKVLLEILQTLHVLDIHQRTTLIEKLNAKFTNYYLNGYFEAVTTEEYGLWFTDYNRTLGDLYQDFSIPPTHSQTDREVVKGQIGSPGEATGTVQIILSQELNGTQLNKNSILVTDMTTPNFIPLMKQAKAIITDLGGVLSHAAIVSREMKIPCIVGTKNATQILKNGDLIEVDAKRGVVRILN